MPINIMGNKFKAKIFGLIHYFLTFFEKIAITILDALFGVFRFSKEYFKGPDIFIHNRF